MKPKRYASEREQRSTTTRQSTSSRDRGQSNTPPDHVASVHRTVGNQRIQRQAQGRDQQSDLNQTSIDAATMKKGVVRALKAYGFRPPEGSGLTMKDYVSVRSQPSLHAVVNLDLNGNPLPTSEKIRSSKPEGGYAKHSLEPPRKWLMFHYKTDLAGMPVVFAEITDLETGITEEQRYVEAVADVETMALGALEKLHKDSFGSPTNGRIQDKRVSPDTENDSLASTEPQDKNKHGSDPRKAGLEPKRGQGGTETSTNSLYTVKEGDTLRSIAEREYGDAQKWPVIYEAEGNNIRDPDLIHVGQTLKIPSRSKAEIFDSARYDPPASYGLGRGRF